LAGSRKGLIENTAAAAPAGATGNDVLSDVLRSIRLSGSLQFCFMPTGQWQTDAAPSLGKLSGNASGTIPFHIIVEGQCWMKMEGRTTNLAEGDVVAFPFGTGHQLGAGNDGQLITPVRDLPPKPWREMPVLRYGDAGERVRLLCGYLQCDALRFGPLREAMPTLLHVRTHGADEAGWLKETIRQIVTEVDRPRSGGLSMLERLTEITFIELLRHQIAAPDRAASGWWAGLADPAIGRCLALIHSDPRRNWTVEALASAAYLSSSTLAEHFEATLGTAPWRFVRGWRLYLASVALATTAAPIAAIADEAGYGTDAAFSRAFSRAYAVPPAAWRQEARRGQR
jgi:AraC-like DNA-binding protein